MTFPERARVPLGLLLLALLAAPSASAPPAARARNRVRPNVLLVFVDTLSAEHVGFLQPGIGTTPSLDRLASDGVVFSRAYGPTSWTEPAVASLLTGVMPNRHGLVHLFDALKPALPVFPERLKAAGWKTAGVVSHVLLGRRFGFARGFDSWDESPTGSHDAITSDKVTDAALAWLNRNADSQFFLLVHYFDPHYVYNHHPEFDRTSWYHGPLKPGMGIWDLLDYRPKLTADDTRYLVDLYREEIAYTDHHIGRLLDGLAATKHEKDTLVVFLADHGEEFNRHGWISHTKNLYDDVLRVPLVVRYPGRLSHRVVDDPVSLLDVSPTLLELVGLPPTPDGEGRSLVPLLSGKQEAAAERALFSEVSYGKQPNEPDKFLEKMSYKTALRRGRWKLIHDTIRSSWELYDTSADPLEQKSLSGKGLRNQKPLQHELAAWEKRRSATASTPVLTPPPEYVERLRALGYLR